MSIAESTPTSNKVHMTFQEMRDIDIHVVDLDNLVDIKDIQINTSLPREEQLLDFIEQIKNPYCFKVGKVAVKVHFSNRDATIEDCLESYLLSL